MPEPRVESRASPVGKPCRSSRITRVQGRGSRVHGGACARRRASALPGDGAPVDRRRRVGLRGSPRAVRGGRPVDDGRGAGVPALVRAADPGIPLLVDDLATWLTGISTTRGPGSNQRCRRWSASGGGAGGRGGRGAGGGWCWCRPRSGWGSCRRRGPGSFPRRVGALNAALAAVCDEVLLLWRAAAAAEVTSLPLTVQDGPVHLPPIPSPTRRPAAPRWPGTTTSRCPPAGSAGSPSWAAGSRPRRALPPPRRPPGRG